MCEKYAQVGVPLTDIQMNVGVHVLHDGCIRKEGSGLALTHQQGREHHVVAKAVRKGVTQGRGVRCVQDIGSWRLKLGQGVVGCGNAPAS